MKFSSRSTEDDSPIVELTPLIDVVFLLLIFFMVSSTFKDEARLAVDLPESSAETSDQPPQSLEVVLTADGRYFINGEPLNDADAESAELSVGVSIDLLKQHLLRAAAGRSDPSVVISADRDARHGQVVALLEAARQLNYLKISFTAERGAGSTSSAEVDDGN